jgi:hypothetical protein
MTFSALMGQMTTSPVSSTEYIPSGTDEGEALRYRESLKHVMPVGEDIDYSDDLADSGFLEGR